MARQFSPFSANYFGDVPASGGGTVNFLRADGVFAAPGAAGTNYADAETPAGAINSANKFFALAHAPSTSLQLFLNGIMQTAGSDYTLAVATVTFATAPQTGDTLVAFYRY